MDEEVDGSKIERKRMAEKRSIISDQDEYKEVIVKVSTAEIYTTLAITQS